jgi:heme peroxidase
MLDTQNDDVPAEGAAGETTLPMSRRGFGKTTLGVVAVAGGLGLSGVADVIEETPAQAAPEGAKICGIWEIRSLDGTGNNKAHPDWGAAHIVYPRVAPAAYVDGIEQMPDGPNERYVSNRIFNDVSTTIYSPRNVSMWAFVWGQFLDHTIALRLGRRQTGEDGDPANIPTDDTDPLEQFPNPIGAVFMNRSIPATGSGVTGPREQVNQLSSYIDATAIYGNDVPRLSWIREGAGDGNLANSGARLLMRDGYLPRRFSRGNPDAAPNMVIGAMPDPGQAAVAGDQRANENPMLLSLQTLFAREHNRIVARLPKWMSEEDRFQVARAVIIAEQQYITYNEFLPALGLDLPAYSGYKASVDASITNEFAAIGYRAHSMINNELTVTARASRYDKDTIDWLKSLDITVTYHGDEVRVVAPHGFNTFFQPDLIERLGLGPVLKGVSMMPMCKNDETIVNKIRSLVAPGAVNDLAAVDVHRGRDHGFPSYNEIRKAYGLAPKKSFKDITGEDSEDFPADPLLTPGNEINSPHCVDFVALFDLHGRPTTAEADNAVRGVRRTPLAARLKAVYHDVDKVDAFVGMICEKHLPNKEFGELQHAIWRRQFAALRDGDRFFYKNNPLLQFVRRSFGIGYETTLGDLIARNTDVARHELPRHVFFAGFEGEVDEQVHQGAAAAVVVPAVAATALLAGPLSRRNGDSEPARLDATDPTQRRPWYCGQAEV